MKGYIGERVVQAQETPFASYTQTDWIAYFIDRYGSIDGDHHKQWVLTQAMRLCHGAPVTIKLAEWADGAGKIIHSEYRITVGAPGPSYDKWLAEREAEDCGWDPGVPP